MKIFENGKSNISAGYGGLMDEECLILYPITHFRDINMRTKYNS